MVSLTMLNPGNVSPIPGNEYINDLLDTLYRFFAESSIFFKILPI